MGKVSKQVLQAINDKIREKVTFQQWRNTSDVLKWFNNFENKERATFVKFDIENFYPNITSELLDNSLDWANQLVEITPQEKEIIRSTKQNILFSQNPPWSKKNDNKCDVTMGSWDGAEACELVGLFLLSQLGHLNIDLGLYRDDGLGLSTQRPQQVERTKKFICQIFKNNGLKVTIEANKKVVDFLDVELNLNNGSHRPYLKPNSSLLYVNSKSNHPPSILKNIPVSVNKRLSELSSSEKVFEESVQCYQKALNDSGYTHVLKFKPPEEKRRRQRQRKIVWYNPPYSKNMATNVGKQLFKLMEKHFPKGHVLEPIINKNTVKLSYSCLPNVENIISKHNKKILNPVFQDVQCKCQPEECPVGGKCETAGIVYKATILTEQNEIFKYIGLSEKKFKDRKSQHESSFRSRNPNNKTNLSVKIWELEDNNINFELKWEIVQNAKPYHSGHDDCQLCLSEIYIIIFQPMTTVSCVCQKFTS